MFRKLWLNLEIWRDDWWRVRRIRAIRLTLFHTGQPYFLLLLDFSHALRVLSVALLFLLSLLGAPRLVDFLLSFAFNRSLRLCRLFCDLVGFPLCFSLHFRSLSRGFLFSLGRLFQ